jgi:hypothetical protein
MDHRIAQMTAEDKALAVAHPFELVDELEGMSRARSPERSRAACSSAQAA